MNEECSSMGGDGGIIARRGFVGLMGKVFVATAVGGGLLLELNACNGADTDEPQDSQDSQDSSDTQEDAPAKRTITDDAGRELTIPTASNLKRIYFTSALAQIFCYTLAPSLAAGTAMQFSERELKFLPAGTEDLTYLGTLKSNGTIDREALIAADVQIIFSISSAALTESNISDAVELQDQIAIPVVLVDGSFERIGAAYRFLGDCIGQAERAEELAAYIEEKYRDISAVVEKIPEDERVGLYYAEGSDGLQTESSASQHALAFKLAGARNVAQVESSSAKGMSNVSLESVLMWDPEVIVAWSEETGGGADEAIRNSADWKPIKAVRDGRVYTMPSVPFSWCDRPAAVNRFLGMQWVCNMLYPSLYDVDMVEEMQNFFTKFYWTTPTREECLDILGNSYPPVERIK